MNRPSQRTYIRLEDKQTPSYVTTQPYEPTWPYEPTQPSSNAVSTRRLTHRSHYWNLFWKEISWRFAIALICSGLIFVVLHFFALKGTLGDWDRRWFNTLTILFSALVSLSLGSLLGLLGSMVRWPLLARKRHTPRDVDLILGMSNPTGSLRLIWNHIKGGKWNGTTWWVLVYLISNITSRLSVAWFGLTYDLNEIDGIEYPAMVSDWGTRDWFNLRKDLLKGVFGSDYTEYDPNLRRMDNYGSIGLVTVNTYFNWTDPSSYTVTNMSGQGLDRKVEGNKVTYSYSLKEYRGLDERSSGDKVLHSSASCVGRTLYKTDIYENGKKVGTLRNVKTDSPDYVHILDGIYTYFTGSTGDYLWAARMDWDGWSSPLACATTYLYTEQGFEATKNRNATYYECTTCLTDQNDRPGFGSLLRNLSAENASYAASVLLHFPLYERVYAFYSIDQSTHDNLGIRLYSSMNKTTHFTNDLGNVVPDDKGQPRLGVPLQAELYAAHLAARPAILSIIGAERQLPKVTLEPGASVRPYIKTELQVKWARAIGVLVAILIVQLLGMVFVLFICRKVFVRDHNSILDLARLLRTAMKNTEGSSSVAGGEELAKYMENKENNENFENVRLSYGTREVNGVYEMDLWSDVQNHFRNGLYR